MPGKTLIFQILQSFVTIYFASLLLACGGSGSSSSPPPQSVSQPEESSLIIESLPPLIQVPDPVAPAFDCNGIEVDFANAFTDITSIAGLCYSTSITSEDNTTSRVSGGVAVSDYNHDGRLDIYVTHGRNSPGRLFSMQTDSSFVDVTQQAGISSLSTDNGAVFIDLDLDGWSDLISVQQGPNYLQIFGNNGDGTFSDITSATGINLTKPAFSIAAGDQDLDGDLDLFFAHWSPVNKQSQWEFLWQNQGDSTFKDISNIVDNIRFSADDPEEEQSNFEFSFTPIFADINQDRYPDILLASDFGFSQVLINNAGTQLVDTTTHVINDRAGMGAAVADYDNDGDLDWFVTSIGDTREEFLTVGLFDGSRLYKNDGDGNFENVTDFAGVRQGFWAWGSCFADFNNDGFLDIFVVNGFDGMTEEQSVSRNYESFNQDPALLYISNGDGTFTDQATELGVLHTTMGRGLVCYDYDRDGDVDMLIANSGEAPSLYRNNNFSVENNFLNIRLVGHQNNAQAVGARIYVSADGQQQMRELQLGGNYISQDPVEAHFGLGNHQIVDLRIIWPGLEGQISEINNVQVNQFLTIQQPN